MAIDIFQGRKMVLATMHGKERVMAPILEQALGVKVILPTQFNSDQFGTFTREVKRTADQLEAARRKLELAMSLTKVDLGVASEGSFGGHPSMPFIQSNLELILLIDQKYHLEIRGHYQTPETNIAGQYVNSVMEALDFAYKIGFPEHGLIVRLGPKSKLGIYKNLHSEPDIRQAVRKLLSIPLVNRVFVESDMRAHRNPTRMQAIQEATRDLVKNIQSICPQCQTPGFVAVDFERGLPCRQCGLATTLPEWGLYECSRCKYSQKRPVAEQQLGADPQYCQSCNP